MRFFGKSPGVNGLMVESTLLHDCAILWPPYLCLKRDKKQGGCILNTVIFCEKNYGIRILTKHLFPPPLYTDSLPMFLMHAYFYNTDETTDLRGTNWVQRDWG